MKIAIFVITTIFLLHSNECKIVSNKVKDSDPSTVSVDFEECNSHDECSASEVCIDKQCVNPCSLNLCGFNAECIPHNRPVCKCVNGYIGDPFRECIRKDGRSDPVKINTAIPPTCGFFSFQRDRKDGPVCACLPGFFGTPPNCYPECRVHEDCASNKVCYSNKCTDICENVCNVNANCKIIDHATICECKKGFEGDPYDLECWPSLG